VRGNAGGNEEAPNGAPQTPSPQRGEGRGEGDEAFSMKKPNVERARELRRASTDAESLLWRHLRNRNLNGHKFSRQEPVGRFVADFICRRKKLIVELDGGQHTEQVARDSARTAALTAAGYQVIRFWNNDVLANIEGVVMEIGRVLDGLSPPHPGPLPVGEREVL
jgi:very-short-patch-repair endonuclease